MDDKKKKKYVIPEAEIVDFGGNDIITLSGGADANNWWGGSGDHEGWPFGH